MQWYGFRVHVVLLALFLGLVALMGAQRLYELYNYKSPLVEVLDKNKALASYQIKESRGGTILIELQFKEDVNLMKSYRDVNRAVKDILGDRPYELQLIDTRDEQLERAYFSSQFAIQEAMAKGNFRDMAEVVYREARSIGGEAQIYIDQQYIYVQMNKDGRYLHEVIERTDLYGGCGNTPVLTRSS